MVAAHKVVPPSLNSTVPLGDAAEVKVTASVMDAPKLAGLALLLSPNVGSVLESNNRRDCVGAAAVVPPWPSLPAAREARTPHRLPAGAPEVVVSVLPLTVQVSGVQTSNLIGAAPPATLLVAVNGMELASGQLGRGVPGFPGAKTSCWPVRMARGVLELMVELLPNWPLELLPQHWTAPAVVSAHV